MKHLRAHFRPAIFTDFKTSLNSNKKMLGFKQLLGILRNQKQLFFTGLVKSKKALCLEEDRRFLCPSEAAKNIQVRDTGSI